MPFKNCFSQPVSSEGPLWGEEYGRGFSPELYMKSHHERPSLCLGPFPTLKWKALGLAHITILEPSINKFIRILPERRFEKIRILDGLRYLGWEQVSSFQMLPFSEYCHWSVMTQHFADRFTHEEWLISFLTLTPASVAFAVSLCSHSGWFPKHWANTWRIRGKETFGS